MNTNEYVKILEEECGKNQAHKKKHIKKSIGINALYIPEKPKPDYSWTIKDRLKKVNFSFKESWNFLKNYNPFDFKTYEEEYNPYGFDKIYTKFKRTSTPLTRLKHFWEEFQSSIKHIKDSFLYTPLAVKHYRKNKKRIDWFEENLSKLFADKLDVDAKKELDKHGYDLDEQGRICYKVKE
jgi:hypothetical protein